MKSYRLSELSNAEVESLKARPRIDFSSIFGIVNPIVDDVRQRGDDAVKDYTAKFDKVKLDKIVENVSELPDPELEAAVREAFDVAYDNIYAFHLAQKSIAVKMYEKKQQQKKIDLAQLITSRQPLPPPHPRTQVLHQRLHPGTADIQTRGHSCCFQPR